MYFIAQVIDYTTQEELFCTKHADRNDAQAMLDTLDFDTSERTGHEIEFIVTRVD